VKYFGTAEINSTFYRYPSREMVYGWLRSSPNNFVFAAKLPKIITHETKLDSEEHIENHLVRFLELMDPLRKASKLGPLLIQLPPSFSFNKNFSDFSKFLKLLPSEFRFAVEFRNLSWIKEETWETLRKYNVAYTIVDEPLLPPDIHVTADFAYFRWHGRGRRPWYNYRYKREELELWVPKVLEVKDKVNKVYGFFNNHFQGYAIENCVEILEMLGEANKEQIRIKDRVTKYLGSQVEAANHKTLESFGFHKVSSDIESALLSLMDERRLNRDKEIKDDDLEIRENDHCIKGRIRNYSFVINEQEQKIIHDCNDWEKRSSEKKLCKHIGKIFLSLPQDRTKKIINNIIENHTRWSFESPNK
jgi:uncharacterized protein YecE (DUF72 family)